MWDGWNSHQSEVASVRKALPNLGIDEVTSVQSARSVLESSGIAYLPADHLLALELLHLRAALGTAAMVLSLAEMISPEDAKSNAIALWRCHDRPPLQLTRPPHENLPDVH